jgi:hypothetical protein
MTVIRITDISTRPEIEQAIPALRAKAERLPVHCSEQRDAIAEEHGRGKR